MRRPPPLPPDLSRLQPVLLAALVADAFHQLRICASVWTNDVWRAIHLEPCILDCEVELGAQPMRAAYNMRCHDELLRTRNAVVGTHAGLHDMFVPIGVGPDIGAILVVGPFATARPTSADVLDRWQTLTGSHGRIGEPSFSRFVTATLGTLTLDGPALDAFRGLLLRFAALAGGQGTPATVATEALAFAERLREVTFAADMWEAARSMVDERTAHIWPLKLGTLTSLGLRGAPRHAVVGLCAPADDLDPLSDLLRRDALQRAAVDLSRTLGDIACGQVGAQGITLLVDHPDSGARARAKLLDRCARFTKLARHFGYRLGCGIALAQGPESLAARYRAALGAAEKALSRRAPTVFGEILPHPSTKELRQLRLELATCVGEPPDRLAPRFDRYVEAVLVHCGYQPDATRAQLEAGIDRLAEPLLASGALDPRSFDDLCALAENAAQAASTVGGVVGPYRLLASELGRAITEPTSSRHARSMARALDYVHANLGERLRRDQVARVAGFAPGYFSRLLRKEHGSTFERYVKERRVARARQMLDATTVSIERVGRLVGFPSRTYFHRVFRAAVGVTPLAYRSGSRPTLRADPG